MGTEFRIIIYGDDEGLVRQAALAAFERAEELEQIFSDYRPESELSRAVKIAVVRPRVVSPLLYRLLDRSLYFSRLTDGAFDITVGPLVELWRACRRGGRVPGAEQLQAARSRVGYRKVLLNPRTHSLRLAAEGMRLDLGGIAKGFAADEMLRIVQSRGFPSCLIDAGGDLRLGMHPPGRKGWQVRLEDDLSGDRSFELEDSATATSGDRFQFFEVDGIRYSHIIDPRSGSAVRHHGEVTVVALDALTADALATAMSVLDTDSGVHLADSLEGVEVRISRAVNGTVRLARSAGFPP